MRSSVHHCESRGPSDEPGAPVPGVRAVISIRTEVAARPYALQIDKARREARRRSIQAAMRQRCGSPDHD
jgi:hypothetical protein